MNCWGMMFWASIEALFYVKLSSLPSVTKPSRDCALRERADAAGGGNSAWLLSFILSSEERYLVVGLFSFSLSEGIVFNDGILT
jgi:hypothetical protein